MKVLDFLKKLFPIEIQLASLFIKNPVSQEIEAVLIGEAATILGDLQAFHASRAPAAK